MFFTRKIHLILGYHLFSTSIISTVLSFSFSPIIKYESFNYKRRSLISLWSDCFFFFHGWRLQRFLTIYVHDRWILSGKNSNLLNEVEILIRVFFLCQLDSISNLNLIYTKIILYYIKNFMKIVSYFLR